RAGQSSLAASTSHPGRSPQATGIQRERARATEPATKALAPRVPLAEGVAPVDDGTASADGAPVAASAPPAGMGAGARLEQAASVPRIAATPKRAHDDMWVILLEALGALVALAIIVWWT